jgi:SMC interacting uncharacterized protein involved in chromosome segregation
VEREQDLQSKKSELSRLSREMSALRVRVESQELNVVDVEHLRREKSKLEETIESAAAQKERAEKVVWDMEVEVNTKKGCTLPRILVPKVVRRLKARQQLSLCASVSSATHRFVSR